MTPAERAELAKIKIWTPDTLEEISAIPHAQILAYLQPRTYHTRDGEADYPTFRRWYMGQRADLELTPLQADGIIYNQEKMKDVIKAAPSRAPDSGLVAELRASVPEGENGRKAPDPKPSDFAATFARHYRFARLDGAPASDLLIRRGTTYTGDGSKFVREITERAYPDASTFFKVELVTKLADRNTRRRDEFDATPAILNCRNCLYDLREAATVPATDSMMIRTQIAAEYRPELGPSKKFQNFLREVMPDKDLRKGLLEVCASVLLRGAIPLTKYVILQGSGANGKSTLLKVLRALLGGDANVSNVSWHDLEHNRFAPAKLEGKYANIFWDLDEAALKSTSTIKSLCDYEPMHAEHKFGQPFTLTFTGRILFSCNVLPEMPKLGKADLRRMLLFRFEEVFEGESRNKGLLAELASPEELSRILNTLLPIAAKMVGQGRMEYDQPEQWIYDYWQRHSSSAREFTDKCVSMKPDARTESNKMYADYKAWCRTHNYTVNSRQTLHAKLTEAGFRKATTTYKGKGAKYWLDLEYDTQPNKAQTQQKL